jgi:hypothetical protein
MTPAARRRACAAGRGAAWATPFDLPAAEGDGVAYVARVRRPLHGVAFDRLRVAPAVPASR